MRILVEEHQYDIATIKDVLHGIDVLVNLEGKASVHYVGYFYNTLLKDCVFILPKVVIDSNNQLVLGKYRPEDIVNLTEDNPLKQADRDFLYKFSVWIYRAIVVYKSDKRCDSSIIFQSKISQLGNGRRKLSNTFLDVILSILQFNKENQSLFFTIVKNLHTGFNKINWTRTIGGTTAIMQGNQPFYLNPINKKRQINFDEELLIIFFSIINYVGDTYGFPKHICCQFQLITGKQFETYLHGYGKTRLQQIKYKYFSDKSLYLWQLCYCFFEQAKQINSNFEQKEYLLSKYFYVVFEAMIDELIGDNPLPDGMDKKQEDGKIVDHLFTAKSLIENEHQQTYYIGDSKYYKMGHELSSESIYKQYTYARNVIQWNLDIFNDPEKENSQIQIRDEETEGYNIIPNFFISAMLDKEYNYTSDGIQQTDRKYKRHKQIQFKNRLFDRDTLLLFHYDVNFLFVVSLYGRNNSSQKAEWKKKIREIFRNEIQNWLQEDYVFYALKAHDDVDGSVYVRIHFKELIGKLYRPFKDPSIYLLALDMSKREFEATNQLLIDKLVKSFYLKSIKLGEVPSFTTDDESLSQ